MLKRIAKPALVGATSLFVLLATATASAEYRVTAFGYTGGYDALVKLNADAALTTLDTRSALDYAEANNLCVAKILTRDLDGALTSCELAITRTERTVELTASKKKEAQASIYSNLGVTKALAGDMDAAKFYLKKALGLNARDENAKRNFASVIATQPQTIAVAH